MYGYSERYLQLLVKRNKAVTLHEKYGIKSYSILGKTTILTLRKDFTFPPEKNIS